MSGVERSIDDEWTEKLNNRDVPDFSAFGVYVTLTM
jgi:hypothetical protein